jgi:hypothetical protein
VVVPAVPKCVSTTTTANGFLKKELLQINKMEAKVMRKQLEIIGIVAILVWVGLSGCNQKVSDESNFNKTSKEYTLTVNASNPNGVGTLVAGPTLGPGFLEDITSDTSNWSIVRYRLYADSSIQNEVLAESCRNNSSFIIKRGFVVFDTRSIPCDAVITSVALTINNLHMVNNNGNIELISTDRIGWDDSFYFLDFAGWFHLSNGTNTVFFKNPDNLMYSYDEHGNCAVINTTFVIRCYEDIQDSPPPDDGLFHGIVVDSYKDFSLKVKYILLDER